MSTLATSHVHLSHPLCPLQPFYMSTSATLHVHLSYVKSNIFIWEFLLYCVTRYLHIVCTPLAFACCFMSGLLRLSPLSQEFRVYLLTFTCLIFPLAHSCRLSLSCYLFSWLFLSIFFMFLDPHESYFFPRIFVFSGDRLCPECVPCFIGECSFKHLRVPVAATSSVFVATPSCVCSHNFECLLLQLWVPVATPSIPRVSVATIRYRLRHLVSSTTLMTSVRTL